MAFFAFVVAPVAFHSLASAHEAGIVVGGTLRVLHWIGLIGGGAFWLATGWLWLWAEVPARMGFARQLALTAVMLRGDGLFAVPDTAGDGGGSRAGGWGGGDGFDGQSGTSGL